LADRQEEYIDRSWRWRSRGSGTCSYLYWLRGTHSI